MFVLQYFLNETETDIHIFGYWMNIITMKKNYDSSDSNDQYDGAVCWASTQSVKYQTLTKVRFGKLQSNYRIGKISEIDPSAFLHDAEQEQKWQNFWNRQVTWGKRWARTESV